MSDRIPTRKSQTFQNLPRRHYLITQREKDKKTPMEGGDVVWNPNGLLMTLKIIEADLAVANVEHSKMSLKMRLRMIQFFQLFLFLCIFVLSVYKFN